MFPSKHKDPERAAEQQRALTGLIDFFAPQSAAEAGLMLAAGPVLGKVAKASRAPLKKLYRGVEKWHRGKMVKGGRHVSPEKYSYDLPNPSKKGVWAAEDIEAAEEFAHTFGDKSGYVLEYDVPRKFYDKAATKWSDPSSPMFGIPDWIEGGIPKEYLKKVHKGYQQGGAVVHESLPMTKEYSTDYPVGDKFVYKGVSSVPAQYVGGTEDEGKRYYTYESPPVDRSDFNFIRQNLWPTSVMQKAIVMPEDSLSSAMIEDFLAQPSSKKSGLGFLKKLLKR